MADNQDGILVILFAMWFLGLLCGVALASFLTLQYL